MSRIASVAVFVAALVLAGFTVSQAAQHTKARAESAACSTQCANGCTTCPAGTQDCTTGCDSCPAADGATSR